MIENDWRKLSDRICDAEFRIIGVVVMLGGHSRLGIVLFCIPSVVGITRELVKICRTINLPADQVKS